MIGIYKFTNTITGESYIGQSVNIDKRFIQHKNRHDPRQKTYENTYFHEMLWHYGFCNFSFEILEQCSKEQLNEKEKYYIEKYKTIYPYGYNKTYGGQDSGHTMKVDCIDTIIEIQELLKTTDLSNSEIGSLYNMSDQTISDINSGRTWFFDTIQYPIRNGRKVFNKRFEKRTCSCCGKLISKKAKSGLCHNCLCESISKKPDKDTLYKLLCKNSFCSVARKYGVTDNAVRRWCDIYNIPRKSSYYKEKSA